MRFIDNEHKSFYEQRVTDDIYRNAFFYLVGICPDTRGNLSSLYDEKEKTIKPESIHAGWQTGGTVRITRLAFNLFSDVTPTAIRFNEDGSAKPYNEEDYKECALYSAVEIFDSPYAPYFWEAIKLRFPHIDRSIRHD